MSEILIDYKAEVEAQTKLPCLVFPNVPLSDSNAEGGGYTPLHLAAISGRFDVFEVLKARGAKLGAIDALGYPTIHQAVGSVTVQILRSILDAGVSVDTRGGIREETPLHRAAQQGNTVFVAFLVEQGADFEAMDALGQTAMQIAEVSGHTDVVQALKLFKDAKNI